MNTAFKVEGALGSSTSSSQKTGLVSGILAARPVDDLMVITSSGIIIRTPVEQISIVGRSTQGVKIINIGDGTASQYCAGQRTNRQHRRRNLRQGQEAPNAN